MAPSINDVANDLAALQADLGNLRTQFNQASQETENRFYRHNDRLVQTRRVLTNFDRRLQAMDRKVNELVERFSNITDANDPRVETILRDLEQLRERADGFYTELESRLHALEGRVNEHDETLAFHGEQFDDVFGRLGNVEEAPMLGIDPETTRVDVTGSARLVTQWGPAIIVGVIVGFVMNWVLRANVDEWTNWKIFWFSLILGASVTCFIAAFERIELNLRSSLSWGRRQAQEAQAETETVIRDAPPAAPTEQVPAVHTHEHA